MDKLPILKWKNDFQKLKFRNDNLNSYATFESQIYTMAKFQKGDDFKLPVIVTGRLITAGIYDEEPYGRLELTAEELKKTVGFWQDIKIYKSHGSWLGIAKGEHVPVDDVVGRIIKTMWNEESQGIDYVAEIMDRGVAYKIASNLINSVSVGFSRSIIWDGGLAFMKSLIPRELSLVFNPRDKSASINVKKLEY